MRLSEYKENMFSFAEREHSRSYRAAKIQNVFNMVVSLQPFLIQFARFFETPQKNTLETTFYLPTMKSRHQTRY